MTAAGAGGLGTTLGEAGAAGDGLSGTGIDRNGEASASGDAVRWTGTDSDGEAAVGEGDVTAGGGCWAPVRVVVEEAQAGRPATSPPRSTSASSRLRIPTAGLPAPVEQEDYRKRPVSR